MSDERSSTAKNACTDENEDEDFGFVIPLLVVVSTLTSDIVGEDEGNCQVDIFFFSEM